MQTVTSLRPSSLLPSASATHHSSRQLNVVEFAAERAAEMQAVWKLLAPAGPVKGVGTPARARQRLLRRRVSSTTVWRWHTRRALPTHLGSQVLGRSRRDRRRPAALRAAAEARRGLETEVWHAKRFAMVAPAWGGGASQLRLPWRARDRGETAALRASSRACTLHDASYWRPLQLQSPMTTGKTDGADAAELLASVLGAVLDTDGALLRGWLQRGGRELHSMLHWQGRRPAGAIAPVRLMPIGGDSAPGVWLFVHDAAYEQARSALQQACSALGSGDGVDGVRVSAARALRFELRGPESHALLVRALQPRADPERAAAGAAPVGAEPAAGNGASIEAQQVAAWRSMQRLTTPASLPPRAALGLTIVHPHAARTPRPPVGSDGSGGTSGGGGGLPSARVGTGVVDDGGQREEARLLRQMLITWPARLADSPLLLGRIVGGASGDGGASVATLPLLLIQQPGSGSGSGSGSGGSGGFGAGWDVLVPVGSGRTVWQALVLAGARAIGQSEQRHLHLHAQQPLFPYDYPDTLAGLRQHAADAQSRRLLHERRPPSRRPNHRSLRIAHPFAADWSALLRLPPVGGSDGDTADEVPLVVLRGAALRAALVPAPGGPDDTASGSRGGDRGGGGRAPRGRGRGGDEAAAAPPPPPPPGAWPTELLPRCLLRVSLVLAGRGVAVAPAAVHACTSQQLAAWRLDRRWRGSQLPVAATKRAGGAASGATPAETAACCGALLGFVSHGGYDALAGRAHAIGFVAAPLFAPLLSSAWNVGGAPSGAVLLLVRNVSSRQFRPVLATVSA